MEERKFPSSNRSSVAGDDWIFEDDPSTKFLRSSLSKAMDEVVLKRILDSGNVTGTEGENKENPTEELAKPKKFKAFVLAICNAFKRKDKRRSKQSEVPEQPAEAETPPVSFEDVYDDEYYAMKNRIMFDSTSDDRGRSIPSSVRGGLAGDEETIRRFAEDS